MSFCPGLSSKVRTIRMWKAQVIVIKKSIFYQRRFRAKYIFVTLHHLRFKTIISTDLGSSIVCIRKDPRRQRFAKDEILGRSPIQFFGGGKQFNLEGLLAVLKMRFVYDTHSFPFNCDDIRRTCT